MASKNTFHIVVTNAQGNERVKKRLSRSQVLQHFANIPRCRVGLEACASSHYFGRELTALGHDFGARSATDPAEAYLRGQKNDYNDYNDARAIAETVRSPGMRFVEIKTVARQDVQSLVRLREGVTPKGIGVLRRVIPVLLR